MISKIKKIEIIGLQKDKDILLNKLQKLGIVEIINVAETTSNIVSQPGAERVNLLEFEEAIVSLASFQGNPGMLEGMVKLKPLVYQDELETVMHEFDYQGLIKEFKLLQNELRNISQQKDRLIQEKQLLSPWRNLAIPLDQIHSTKDCSIILGILQNEDYQLLLESCQKEALKVSYEAVYQDNANVYLTIVYLNEEFQKLEAILKEYHFNFITLSRHTMTVKDRLLDINIQVLILDDEILDIKSRLAEISQFRFKLMVVYDYLANISKRQAVGSNLSFQQFTFLLSGWVRFRDLKLLQIMLNSDFSEMDIFVSEPKPGEEVPTALENKDVLQPFEAVTNLYGQPLYNGLDPSGFLAPFFTLSFGFCMMDAGYGIILLGMMMFYLKKKMISPHGKNLLRLFLFMAISTIFAGIITGSFFGDLISRLPSQFNWLKSLQARFTLFDPIKDSLLFLGLTLVFGFLQIWIGVFIKFVRDLRLDKLTAFILDLPTLLVQTSLLLLVLSFAKVLPAFMLKVALGSLILSAACVIYYQWRSNPDINLKIFWSLFGIYSIVTGNFLADTLSFSRIFALGLTGGLLGMAINTMLFPKGPINGIMPLITSLVAIIALFVFHFFNLAIGILGAYVHTSRLQYLEFFTKFFESGGRPFRPFKEETKYIFLAQENKKL